MAFKYQRRDAATVEKRAAMQRNDFIGIIKDDYRVFTPAKGDNFLRILPPTWNDAEHYGLDVWVHYSVGPDNASVLCPNKMEGKHCTLCDESKQAGRDGDEDRKRELSANRRVLVWVLNRKDPSKGAEIWPMPWSLDRDIAKLCKDPDTQEIFFIDDPENGYDVSFERSGEGINTKYVGTRLSRRPSAVPKKVLDYVVEHPLPTTLLYKTDEEIQELYAGKTKERPGQARRDDDDDEAPRRRRADDDDDDEPKAKTRRRADDDDDDEAPRRRRDADDEDEAPRRRRADDDDDDEAPKAKSKRRADDDDDEPKPKSKRRADDDDDDEAPKAKTKRRNDDDDDEPKPKSKRRADDDDEDEAPRRRRADDDEDEAPRRRRDADDEDEDEVKPKSKRRQDDDDEDEAPAFRPRGNARKAEPPPPSSDDDYGASPETSDEKPKGTRASDALRERLNKRKA